MTHDPHSPSFPTGAIASWWAFLSPGERAELRRVRTAQDAVYIQGFHTLRRALREQGMHDVRPERVAPVALVLAAWKQETSLDDGPDARERVHKEFYAGASLPQIFGRPVGDKSPLSNTRFSRLVQVEECQELVQPLRRAIAVVRQEPVNLGRLAQDLYYWGPSTRRRWAMEYYDVASVDQA